MLATQETIKESTYQKNCRLFREQFLASHNLPSDCENMGINKYDDNRVFCRRTNDHVSMERCRTCTAERKKYETQEW